MLKRPAAALVAVLITTASSQAWGRPDIYVERAAMAEVGRDVCNVDNRRVAARYKSMAAFFTGSSRQSVQAQVERRKQVLVARLVNASAVSTFCIRIRGRDF